MIYITGDCNGDFTRFSTVAFPEQKEMTKDDYVIICGDFGLWHDTNEERYWLKWWREEIPSEEEMAFGLKTLKENGNQVDYIVSHCCPQRIAYKFSNGEYQADALTEYFDRVDGTVDFHYWFFGHYHNDRQIREKYLLLYMQFIRIA